MLNKDKVNEIVADMQEEERKEKLRQEGIADKFLENRLEYYVAMVISDSNFKSYEGLCNIVTSDIEESILNEDETSGFLIKEIVMKRIVDGLSKYGIYVMIIQGYGKLYFFFGKIEDKIWAIASHLYDESHEVHDLVEKYRDGEYKKLKRDRLERKNNLEAETRINDKKEAREGYLLFTFLAVMIVIAIYLCLTK